MFRNKGFTTAFVILSTLIVLLLGIFIYLVAGGGMGRIEDRIAGRSDSSDSISSQDTLPSGSITDPDSLPDSSPDLPPDSESDSESDTESETETESESETETEPPVDRTLRALKADEEHLYPVIEEVIPEMGVITVIRPGDAGEGLVFHALPQFDDAGSEGNIMRTEGSYDVSGKIFIIDNERPYLMYRTSEDLFVTSAAVYVSYEPTFGRKTELNANHLGSYGTSESYQISASVYADDGNHLVFSLFNYDADSQMISPVLLNVVAVYDENGTAHFEYHNTDGKVHSGSLSFRDIGEESGYTEEIYFAFDKESPVVFTAGAVSEMWLHH